MIKYLFYFSNINSIGGVETFFYNLARLHGDKDITVVYKNADVDQVKRLAKYVRVRRWNGKPIECEIAFFNYSADIFEFVKAKEYFQMIHADYSTMKLSPDDRINNYIAVSKTVADKFEEYTGKDNQLVISNLKKMIEIGLASRMICRIPLIPGFNNINDQSESERELRNMGFTRIDKFNYIIK